MYTYLATYVLHCYFSFYSFLLPLYITTFSFFVPIFSVPSLAASHVSGYGVVAWWRAVGANKEKEDVCRMGGQSVDEESGVCGQLHA